MISGKSLQWNHDTIGGWLCLDFINTAGWHDSATPTEYLAQFIDLLAWSAHHKIISPREIQAFLKYSKTHSSKSSQLLDRAIAFREALFRIFSAISIDSTPEARDVALLNAQLAETMAHTRVTPSPRKQPWVTTYTGETPERILWTIAQSAISLLGSSHLEHLKKCNDENCGWLFLDKSKNQSRKWCNMQDCGNRAKARRYYRQKKALTTQGSHYLI